MKMIGTEEAILDQEVEAAVIATIEDDLEDRTPDRLNLERVAELVLEVERAQEAEADRDHVQNLDQRANLEPNRNIVPQKRKATKDLKAEARPDLDPNLDQDRN